MKTLLQLSFCLFVCCSTGSPSEAPQGSVCQAGFEISAPAGEWGHIVLLRGLEIVLQGMNSGLVETRDGGRTWRRLEEPPAPGPAPPVFTAVRSAWALGMGDLWRLKPDGNAWGRVALPAQLADGVPITLAPDADGKEVWIGGSVYLKTTQKEAPSLERRFWRQDAPGKFEVLRAALYRTTDGGSSWQEAPLPAPGALEVSDLHFAKGRLIAVTDRGIFESRNGGGDWTAVLPSTACVSRAFRVDFSGRYFFATGGGGANGSPRWMLFTNQASSYLLAAAANQDHLCEVDNGNGMGSVEKVVATADGLITMDREGRLRRSDNRGRHWEDVSDSERVIDIEANPGGGVLVLTEKGLTCVRPRASQ
jgi:photosystem II stability/assembly factor-like uncharacterized protein